MNTIELEIRPAQAEEACQEVRTEVKPLVELSESQLTLVGGGTGNVIFA
jgi:hypothetical protein